MIKNLKSYFQKFPFIAKKYRYLREFFGLIRKEKLSIYGFLWKGNKLVLDGSFEPNEIKIVSFFLNHVETVLNIGANQGFYTCISLSKNKKVFAFEPDSLNFKYLIENIKINNWSESVEAYPLAVSNHNGLQKLYGNSTGASLIPGWGGTSKKSFKLIPTIKLDNLILDHKKDKPLLIIVDIEGAEKLMLEGAKKLLNMELKPIWLIEISIDEHQPLGTKINPDLIETFKVFFSKGYRSFTAERNLTEIKMEEIQEIFTNKENSLLFHNFVFLDKFYSEEILKNLRTYLALS